MQCGSMYFFPWDMLSESSFELYTNGHSKLSCLMTVLKVRIVMLLLNLNQVDMLFIVLDFSWLGLADFKTF